MTQLIDRIVKELDAVEVNPNEPWGVISKIICGIIIFAFILFVYSLMR